MKLNSQQIVRLENEKNIWFASVRPDGRPHLVPVWFVWNNGSIYICISKNSIKGKNIQNNSQVAISLEDGSSVLICEGEAESLDLPWSDEIADIFEAKYDWNIKTDREYDMLVLIRPKKWLIW